MHTSWRTFRTLLTAAVVLIGLSGTALLSGCGSGGGGEPNPTPTPTSFRSVTAGFDLLWAALFGAPADPAIPASIASLRVTLRGAGVDGSDVTVVVNRRPNSADAYSEHIDFPVPVRVASGLVLEVKFYTEANAAGSLAGETNGTVSIRDDGSGIGAITTGSRVSAVKVLPDQSVLAGEQKELLFEARNADGALVPVSRQAVTVTVQPSDANRLSAVVGGSIRGLLPGTASVTVTIDGVVSIPETVTIGSNAAMSIAPSAVTLPILFEQQFTAQVTDAPDTRVVWSVREGADGGAISSEGLYKAPSQRGVFHVDAVSVYDGTKTASVIVTVNPVITIRPGATAVTLRQPQAFTATVAGTADSDVSWNVLEGPSGGTVTPDGLYTAPDQPGTYHLVATSREDPAVQATITITVQAGSGTVIIE